MRIENPKLYDVNNFLGLSTYVLSSTGSGIAWSTPLSMGLFTGTLSNTQIAFGNGNNNISGISTFVYWNTKVGVGTAFPNALVDVRGDLYANNILLNGSVGRSIGLTTDSGNLIIFGSDSTTTQGYDLKIKAGNSSVTDEIGGDVYIYGGIADNAGSVILAHTGVSQWGLVGVGGDPTQLLDVFGNTRIRGALYDFNNSTGTYRFVLSSTGAGIAWSSLASTGVTTGTVADTQIAFGNGNNSLLGISTFVYWQNKVGIGIANPSVTLDVLGSASISGVTTSAFSGDGRLLTTLNASNLASGTVPSARVSGSYSGISSVGNLDQLSVSGISSFNAVYLRGSVRDLLNSQGSLGQILVSTGTGVAWSSVASTGVTTGTVADTQIAFGNGNNSLLGISTFVYWQNKVGIGIANPSVTLDVLGSASISGVTTSAFSGDGRLLTTLNASNLASGTVPSARVSGSYSGISSVGNLDQLSVSGISSFNAVYLRGSVRDLLNSQGSLGQILVSTGTGVAWSSISATGVATGAVGADQIAFGQGNNALLGISTFVYWQNKVGIGTQYPEQILDVRGDSLINNITIGLGSWQHSSNTVVGKSALFYNLSQGQNNVIIGNNAANITTPWSTVGIGFSAFSGSAGFQVAKSVAIGAYAGQYINTGNDDVPSSANIAIGYKALQGSAVNIITGSENIAIGRDSGANITSGSFNIFIGSGAGNTGVAGGGSYQIGFGHDIRTGLSNMGAWGGNTNATRTDLGIGSWNPTARVHIETLNAANKGLYVAGYSGQTSDLLNIVATSNGGAYYVVVSATGSVGIGTSFPTALLDVRGDASISGVTTSAFSGDGRLLTTLNASNLASGTVPSARVSGSYSGISSVGNLDQLSVSGISSFNAVYLRGSVRDLLNSQGSLGQILVSTGTGVAWSSLASTGVTTGTVADTQIAFGNGNNSLLGISTFVYWQNKVGIGVANPSVTLDVLGSVSISGVTTSAFSGDGRLLTTLNASNLASGTVPSARVSGSYSGISSVGNLDQLSVIGVTSLNALFLRNVVNDSTNGVGVSGQVLKSFGASGVVWSPAGGGATVTLTDTQIAFGDGSNSVSGISTLVYWRNKVGVGTQYPEQTLDVRGDASISGVTTSAFSGDGRLLTTLNASNLASGTVPTARVSGSYSGISSVGNLDQLSVSGISSFNAVYLRGSVRDLLNSQGSFGQILVSTGTGVAWSSVASTGVTTGTVADTQIAFGNGNNSLLGISTFVYWQNKVGIGTVFPNALVDVRGDLYVNNILLNGSVGRSIGLTTNSGILTIFGSDSTTGDSGNVILRAGRTTFSEAFGGDVYIHGGLGDNAGDVILAHNLTTSWGLVAIGGNAPTQLLDVFGNTRIRGRLYDFNNSSGVYGNILVSTTSGIAWSSVASTGVTTGTVADTQIAFGNQNNSLLGISTFVYWRNLVGIGTQYPTVLLDVRGDVSISGVTTSAFSGDGRLLTTLNASNLASGTVPSARVSGSYSGISSVGNLDQLSVIGVTSLNALFLRNVVNDSTNGIGVSGQVLKSFGASGVVWSPAGGGATVTLTDTQIAFGDGSNSVSGISTFVYWRNKVGIGTQYPEQTLDVRGDASISGVTTSAFSGDGRLLTTLNASNLASGTVPSARVSGSYSGISSVGNLDQLSVSGISSFNAVFLRDVVHDASGVPGQNNQILKSTGVGVTWANPGAGTGTIQGTIAATQVAFGNGADSIMGVSTLTYTGLGSFGIGIANASYALHVVGGTRITGNIGLRDSAVTSSYFISATRTETAATASIPLYINYNYTQSTHGGQRAYGLFFGITQAGNITYTDTFGATGIEGFVQNSNTGVASGATGAVFYVRNTGVGTLQRAYGLVLNANENTGGGEVTNSRQLEIFVGPTFNANNQTRIGIRIAAVPEPGTYTGTVAAAIQFNNTGYSPKDGLVWGSDTNLYRGRPNVLRTDDAFESATSVGVGTTATTQLHVQGNARISGGIFDSSANSGLARSVLVSTGTGIAWTNPANRSITFIFGDGVNPIGIATGYLPSCPFSGTIQSWSIIGDISGDVVIDIWKSGSRVPIKADSITASSKPSLSSQQINSSFTLTSWITSVNVDDLFAFEASGGTVDRATIILRVIT